MRANLNLYEKLQSYRPKEDIGSLDSNPVLFCRRIQLVNMDYVLDYYERQPNHYKGLILLPSFDFKIDLSYDPISGVNGRINTGLSNISRTKATGIERQDLINYIENTNQDLNDVTIIDYKNITPIKLNDKLNSKLDIDNREFISKYAINGEGPNSYFFIEAGNIQLLDGILSNSKKEKLMQKIFNHGTDKVPKKFNMSFPNI